jgi:hypothetical protein
MLPHDATVRNGRIPEEPAAQVGVSKGEATSPESRPGLSYSYRKPRPLRQAQDRLRDIRYGGFLRNAVCYPVLEAIYGACTSETTSMLRLYCGATPSAARFLYVATPCSVGLY